jgi:hypothetical protein
MEKEGLDFIWEDVGKKAQVVAPEKMIDSDCFIKQTNKQLVEGQETGCEGASWGSQTHAAPSNNAANRATQSKQRGLEMSHRNREGLE